MVSDSRNSAKVGVAQQPARSARSAMISCGDLAVVVVAAVLAAPDPGLESLLAQVAARRELQERLDARPRQRHHVLARVAEIVRRARCRCTDKLRQSRQVLLAVEHQLEGLLVGENVLAKLRAERGKPRVDGGNAFPPLGVEPRAAAHEAQVMALENAQLLGIEAKLGAALVKSRRYGGKDPGSAICCSSAGRAWATSPVRFSAAAGSCPRPSNCRTRARRG